MNAVETKLQSKKGFYVGDICYVLDDEIYDDIWGKANYEDGVYETPYGKFAVASTAYGDGSYDDDHGHNYDVDAGVLGIVPWEVLEKQKKWKEQYGNRASDDKSILNFLGHFFEGTNADFRATGRGNDSEDGYFEITISDTTICIHTGDEEEDEEDDYDEYGYDEDDDYPDDYYDDNDDSII